MGPLQQPAFVEGRKVVPFDLVETRWNGPHMVNDHSLLASYEEFSDESKQVLTHDGRLCRHKGKGNLEVFLKCGDDWNFVKLKGVYYVPDVSRNVLSMGRLTGDDANDDGLVIAGEDKAYLLFRGTDLLVADTFKSKKDGRTHYNTIGAFNMADPNFKLDRELSTSEIASFLGKSIKQVDEDLSIE